MVQCLTELYGIVQCLTELYGMGTESYRIVQKYTV